MSGKGVQPNQAWLSAIGGLPIKEPIQDQEPLGDWWVRKGVFISVNPAFVNLSISLPGRNPSFFFSTNNAGAVVYQTTSDVAASTPSNFRCRANISCLANLVIG